MVERNCFEEAKALKDSKISIVIPCKTKNRYFDECLKHCLRLDYNNYDIIVLPDNEILLGHESRRVSVIPTGPVKPGYKRNIAINNSKADIVAFIDSDAYPRRDWLKNALKYFESEDTGVVGGPNLTPPDNTAFQKASGDIMSSPVATGAFSLRYKHDKARMVNELPSCNLLVRKEMIKKIGNFDTGLLTAEDAKLCFEIKKFGKKIIYAPEVQVFHHRRPLFMPHARQIWIYGRDKAWLIKECFSFDK